MARNEDWYWDQFDVEQKGGEFDVSDDRTTFLDEQDIDRDRIADLETQFIDELYDTLEGQTIIDGKNLELSREEWTATYYDDRSAIQTGEATATWGLDLRRVLNEDLEVGKPEYYEWLTRGEVDWASYEQDNAYKKAFNSMKNDKNAWSTYGDPAGIDFLTSDDYTDQQKVNFIRDAADFAASGNESDDKWDIPDDFDNKYTPKYHHTGENKGQPIDPEAVQPYEASPLFDPNSEAIQSRLVGADGQRMTIRTDISDPSAAGSRRNIAATARRAGVTIRPVNVKRPANIPASWGPVTGGDK